MAWTHPDNKRGLVLEYLADGKEVTAQQTAEELDIAVSTAYGHLGDLYYRGFINRRTVRRRGAPNLSYYRLPPKED